MSFLVIKDPAERVTLVEQYVTAMKTFKQCNMTNRELKLAIGDELQTRHYSSQDHYNSWRYAAKPYETLYNYGN